MARASSLILHTGEGTDGLDLAMDAINATSIADYRRSNATSIAEYRCRARSAEVASQTVLPVPHE
eukprot:2186506-Prymnesium_polylepis.1